MTAIVLLLSGCTKELGVTPTEVGQVKVQIQTRAFVGSEQEDVKIEKVRFMLFQQLNGALLNNYSTANGTLDIKNGGNFNITVAPGQYSFAVIINETPELTEKLNAVSVRSSIDEIKFDWQNSKLTAENIPLVNLGEIKVTTDPTTGQGLAQVSSAYKENGSKNTDGFTGASATVSIDMPRSLSQVSLFLRKGEAVADDVVIKDVQVVNIPRYSYLVDQLDTENTKLNLFTGPETAISVTGGDKEYKSKKYHSFSPAIIAEKSFFKNGSDDEAKATDPEYATYLFINATYGGVPTSYKILLREGDANFRLLRNTNYNVYATITQIGSKGIYAVIEPARMYNITVNWKAVEGLVIVSDREADFNKNVNVWSDYTAYSGILKVYKGDAYHDALFKYGSLIAVENDAAITIEKGFTAPADAETTNDVIWYPGGYNVMNITDWDHIPYIGDGGSIASGNTPEQVALGKGDPCRLAALTSHQIGVEGKTDNQQWHMATPAEYAILMKAANGTDSENDNGYCSFHELLIPNVKYRNENGVLQHTHNYQGNYWSTEDNKAFSFDSHDLSKTAVGVHTPERGYAVRCVRNSIPAADVTVIPPTVVYYSGAPVNGTAFYVSSNVPYWKLELIKDGEHKGSSTDYDDFSFEPLSGSGAVHLFEGSYSQSPKAYIARRESRTEDRTFGVKFTSMHFNGEEQTFYFTITQKRYSIKGILSIDNIEENGNIKTEGGKYALHINLTPDDVPMPVGAVLKVSYTYLDAVRATSQIVPVTATDKYEYETEIDMLPNGTPDVIGLRFSIMMDEGTGYKEIGYANYYQNK